MSIIIVLNRNRHMFEFQDIHLTKFEIIEYNYVHFLK